MSNSSVEYRMLGHIPPELKVQPENIASMFDSESEDEIYSSRATGSLTNPYSLWRGEEVEFLTQWTRDITQINAGMYFILH